LLCANKYSYIHTYILIIAVQFFETQRTSTVIVMKLSAQPGNGSGTMTLN